MGEHLFAHYFFWLHINPLCLPTCCLFLSHFLQCHRTVVHCNPHYAEEAPWWQEFWPFLAVGSAAALLGIFIKVAFTNPTSWFYLPEPWFHENAGFASREYWAQLFTIVITMPINFVANKLWTFTHVRNKHQAAV